MPVFVLLLDRVQALLLFQHGDESCSKVVEPLPLADGKLSPFLPGFPVPWTIVQQDYWPILRPLSLVLAAMKAALLPHQIPPPGSVWSMPVHVVSVPRQYGVVLSDMRKATFEEQDCRLAIAHLLPAIVWRFPRLSPQSFLVLLLASSVEPVVLPDCQTVEQNTTLASFLQQQIEPA